MKFIASALLALVFVPVESALGQESALDRRALESTASGPEKTAAAQDSESQDILRGFKSYYIKSDTIYLHRDTLLKELQARGVFRLGADGNGGREGRRCGHHDYAAVSDLGMELSDGLPADRHGARHRQGIRRSGKDCGSSIGGNDRGTDPIRAAAASILSRRPSHPAASGKFGSGKGEVLESKVHLGTSIASP